MELLGAQNAVGINYDSRFNGNSGLGYRIGIGFGYGHTSSLFDEKVKGVGVPIELVCIREQTGMKNSTPQQATVSDISCSVI